MASKLEAYTKLSPDDLEALARRSRNLRVFEPRQDLVREGERPTLVHLIIDGWGCLYKTLPDGKRQILNFILPGDFCGLNVYNLRQLDYSIAALSRMRVAAISPDEMIEMMAAHPRIAQALCWHELVALAIQREWTLNIGQRTAYERLAHLLIELYIRLRTVGRAKDGRCDFPPTQTDLAEATGLTPVHVNRTIQQLRHDSLIELERKQLRILDLPRMMDAAMFNPSYLHLEHEGRHLDANA